MHKNEQQAFTLRRLTVHDGLDVYQLLQKMPAEENGFMNGANGLPEEAFSAWLIRHEEIAQGIGLPEGHVPQILYWFYVDGVPVGFGKLRTRLTDALRISGGHIGYGIAPEYRGRGYCTRMLSLMLQEANKLGIEEVLITVDIENIASRRVAEKCGGVLQDEINRAKYWLKTS